MQLVKSEAARLLTAPPEGAPRLRPLPRRAVNGVSSHRPSCEQAPKLHLFLAELMDSGGLGESLLSLASAARRGGLLLPAAPLLPARIRVWATLVDLQGCGTALDSAELVPSRLSGVRLWFRLPTSPYLPISPPLSPRRGALAVAALPPPALVLGRRPYLPASPHISAESPQALALGRRSLINDGIDKSATAFVAK